MAKHTFGEPVTEDDILEVQGVDYPMMPIGMRAMRRLLTLQSEVQKDRPEDSPVTEQDLDLAIDIALSAVRPEYRDRFKEHIEESVPPGLLMGIARSVMGSFSDLDPTLPESSSGGLSETGSASTAGASHEALTPAS